MAKKIYNVKAPVDHDNERYEVGEPIELEDKAAKPLLDVGAIEIAETEKKK